MAAPKQPLAFLSYVHADDVDGRISNLRQRMSDEVQIQTGKPFPIFQDRNDLKWGQAWEERINASIDSVTFLIPVITPSFFNSPYCREEVERFLDREKREGRKNLILPILYVDTPAVADESDTLAVEISRRQYADWRELRFEPLTSPEVGKALAKLALQVREALMAVWKKDVLVLPAPDQQKALGQARTAEPEPQVKAESVQRVEPPAHVVDPLYRGDFISIGEAIGWANPGDRILVRPGLYRESLLIDKPLEILGDGDRADIVVEANDDSVVIFSAVMGRVSNLTLRKTESKEANYAVDIQQGRLELSGCVISSQSLSCVGIRGGADPRVRGNLIENSVEGGILIYEGSRGTIEDNEIARVDINGIEVENSSPIIRRNRVHHLKSNGLSIREGAAPTVEDNEIFASNIGIVIKGAAPILRRNQTHHNTQTGVVFLASASGVLEDNNIYANTFSGIEVKEESSPVIRANRIAENSANGVYIYDGAKPLIEDNEILNNAYSGIRVENEADVVIRRNHIASNARGGIDLDSGTAVAEDNRIALNKDCGIDAFGTSTVTAYRNLIEKNDGYGVRLDASSQGTFERNQFDGNEKAAWSIADESKVTREDNIEKPLTPPSSRTKTPPRRRSGKARS